MLAASRWSGRPTERRTPWPNPFYPTSCSRWRRSKVERVHEIHFESRRIHSTRSRQGKAANALQALRPMCPIYDTGPLSRWRLRRSTLAQTERGLRGDRDGSACRTVSRHHDPREPRPCKSTIQRSERRLPAAHYFGSPRSALLNLQPGRRRRRSQKLRSGLCSRFRSI